MNPMKTYVLVQSIKQIGDALASICSHPGIAGPSFAQPWKAIETAPDVWDFRDALAVRAFAKAHGLEFAYRGRGGASTPNWRMGRTWTSQDPKALAYGLAVPCPCRTDGRPNGTFLAGAKAMLTEVQAQVAPDLMHLTQFGGRSAEYNITPELLLLPGCSQDAVTAAHARLFADAAALASIPYEFPLSGVVGQTLYTSTQALLASAPLPTFMQLNWLDDRQPPAISKQAQRIPAGRRGLQMIHEFRPGGLPWDWSLVYAAALAAGASYVEIYYASFGGPNASQLYDEIAAAA